MIKYFLLTLLTLCSTTQAHTPSLEECTEFGEMMKNIAIGRDAGLQKNNFMDRLNDDMETIRHIFPIAHRWFLFDTSDEQFMKEQVLIVFHTPLPPGQQERAALAACRARGVVK